MHRSLLPPTPSTPSSPTRSPSIFPILATSLLPFLSLPWANKSNYLIRLSPQNNDSCHFEHDPATMSLSILIALGLLLSYLPQHYRIIAARSSQGISHWFLLLGSTSSTSSLVNVLTLQWGLVRCCPRLSPGQCAESMLGIVQVFLQWACFNIMLVLALVYFPADERYVRVVPAAGAPEGPDGYSARLFAFLGRAGGKARSRASSGSSFDPLATLPPSAGHRVPLTVSAEYALARTLAAVVALHFFFSATATFALLLLLPRAAHLPDGDAHPSARLLRLWATASGLLSMLLAAAQYFPQIVATYSRGLVGSLSMPMMFVQTPGSFVFVYSLAARPGVNWTTWIVYLVSGILQGVLLVMCVVWKTKQRAAGVDDWGRPLASSDTDSLSTPEIPDAPSRSDERSPLLRDSHGPRQSGGFGAGS